MPLGWTAWLGAVLGVMAGVAGVTAWRKWRRPPSPEELERRRRLRVAAHGRVTNGVLIEVRGPVVYYRYHVSGTEYVASQDLSPLLDRLPAELAGLSGHASVKYLPDNPANSIVAAENWCGLHRRSPDPAPPRANRPPGCA